MVHNGVEYGLLQAYAEGYEILHASKLSRSSTSSRSRTCGSTAASCGRGSTSSRRSAFSRDASLSTLKGWVADSGEGRWTVQEAIDIDVPAPVITLSLLTRLRSRQPDSFGAKVIAALRNEFGGHAVEHA